MKMEEHGGRNGHIFLSLSLHLSGECEGNHDIYGYMEASGSLRNRYPPNSGPDAHKLQI
jgi:hypothetical protein